ncbi:alanine racemase [Paracoccus sp. P2]|uniref:alanine racemase n=1 Tax=Paracoccus sp. P2 TaxID=3248840 RepID=UPI00391F2A63
MDISAIDMTGATGWLTIDLEALADNYRLLASRVVPARQTAVVKADAYGLGAVPVSNALYQAGCRDFFVAQYLEAVTLRPALPADARIFVLNGLQPGAEARAAELGLIPVLNSLEQVRNWSALALPAVLQLDTGMSRLGVPTEELQAAREELAQAGTPLLFLMSHLASADDPANSQNVEQLNRMRNLAAEFPGCDICFANSGGIFLGDDYHHALTRSGIALYGGAPTEGRPNPMRPVVALEVAVIHLRNLEAGTAVGYSGTHVTAGPTRVATIAAGYADGLLRSLSNRGAVWFQSRRLPIIGRVSMDSITVDASALPEDTMTLGSRVEILGPHQTLEDVARDAGTISYEILTSLGHRYHRTYLQPNPRGNTS